MNKNTPCLNCTERCELCHKNCPKYKEYRAKIDLINETKKLIRGRYVTHYLSKIGLNEYRGF